MVALHILPNKTANIIKTKPESVSLSCKSHRSKTANITILFANSKHIYDRPVTGINVVA